jgi:uncharacterized protein
MPFSKLLLLGLSFFAFQMSASSYKAEIEQWRHEREARLKSDGGWLTVVGLFWLNEGENTMGTAPSNNMVLPKDSAPASVGVFEFHNGQTQFKAAPGVRVLVNGKPADAATLEPDAADSPDVIEVRNLAMYVIKRGMRFGIRLRDKNSEYRRHFAGLKFFPPDPRYRVVAKFTPYKPPKMISIPNILGEIEDESSPGYVEFTLNGHACRLDPVTEYGTLFFIFKDLTAGKETYPSGRFLNTPMPEDGRVVLDFNQAYNPPCAFTPYATCPLPPKENQLEFRIEAGELRYGH